MNYFLDPPKLKHDYNLFISTSTGNKVSREAALYGTQNIHITGKTIVLPGSIIRGDMGRITIGKYCVISENTVLRPSYKLLSSGFVFLPLTIGDNVYVGEGSIVEASSIGSHVQIGKDCIISKRCVIRDNCFIDDNTILPPDTVIAPFSKVGGQPGKFVGEMPEATTEMSKILMQRYYDNFILENQDHP